MPEENIPETSESALIKRLVEFETHRLLFSQLHLLPPPSRKIYQMFYFEDKSLRQIARELGISINTVKTQKQRALYILIQHQASLLCLLIACLLSQ